MHGKHKGHTGLHPSPDGCLQEPAWLPGWPRAASPLGRNRPEVVLGGSLFFNTKLLTLGCPHQSDLAFQHPRGGAPPGVSRSDSDLPKVSLCFAPSLPWKPLQPTKQRVFSVTKTWKGGKAQHGTSDWKPGPPPWYCECCSGIHTVAQRGLCTGTHFHSPPPGSGWRHCDVTPNTEKGTAHLPCYQNNTLVDNYWIAFKQFCLHTSQNALDCGFYSHVKSTSTRPA